MLYGGYAFDYHRPEINDHMLFANLALITTKQTKENFSVFVTNLLAGQHKLATPYDGSYLSPLYLYPRPSEDLLEAAETEKRPNLAPEFVADLQKTQGQPVSPENTLAYLYAVLYTPGYRTRYADFLKRDFPRVPLTSNTRLFGRLVALGHELIGLHTLQTVPPRITGYPVAGTGEVVKVRFGIEAGAEAGKVWINDAQYFDAVPQAVWDMHIGGYRVAEKWLKDRRGRLLTYDDITHYQNVVAALARTLVIQAELDSAVDASGGWPLQ